MIKIFPQESPITDEVLSQINEMRRLISLEESSIFKRGEKKLESIKIDTDNILFLATISDVFCGYLTLSPSRHEARTTHNVSEVQFFVHPDYRRKKIGTYLVKSAIASAENNSGISRLTGWLKHINPPSKDLLEGLGFKIVENIEPRKYWILNRETHNKSSHGDAVARVL